MVHIVSCLFQGVTSADSAGGSVTRNLSDRQGRALSRMLCLQSSSDIEMTGFDRRMTVMKFLNEKHVRLQRLLIFSCSCFWDSTLCPGSGIPTARNARISRACVMCWSFWRSEAFTLSDLQGNMVYVMRRPEMVAYYVSESRKSWKRIRNKRRLSESLKRLCKVRGFDETCSAIIMKLICKV